MGVRVRLLAASMAPIAVACLALGGVLTSAAGAQAGTETASRSFLRSAELWATVDVCNSPAHPDTIGIRGSMPGDGRARDTMYMRFLVQSLDASTGKWANIGLSADSGFVRVGSAAETRQAGRTFQFKPTASPYTLRGLVEFQWHHEGQTAYVTTRATVAHHTSVAGAEPKDFSAAACTLP